MNTNTISSLFGNIKDELKLTFALLADKKVSNWHKLVPIAAFLYALLPDFLVGPFDDVAVLTIAVLIFNSVLVPDEIVQEHRHGKAPDKDEDEDDDDFVEGKFKEVKKESK